MLIGKKIIGTVGYMGGVMALPEPFTWSWTQMIEYNNDYLCAPNEQINYVRTTNSYHALARNNLVKEMKGDWLVMLDTDHAFDPDIIARLLHTIQVMPELNIQILSGIYQYKGAPYSPKLYRFTRNLKGLEAIGNWDGSEDKNMPRVIPIDSAGAGILLIKKDVFTKLRQAYPKSEPFDIIHPYSEDNSFFLRVKKLGIPVYCDTGIESRHLIYREISMKDYDPSKLDLKKYKVK